MTMGMSFPAWMTDVVSRPTGIGKVFYVNEVTGGDNNNSGVNPAEPFLTIAYAMTQCVSQRNDYIIVLDVPWGSGETTPIVVDKRRVHIIGVCCESMPIVTLTSSDDTAIFELDGNNAERIEIAGLDIGGGVSHAGIELISSTVDLAYIHDCNFGSEYCSDAPLHGIHLPFVFGAKTFKVEHCKFFGTADAGGGQITSDGVLIAEGCKHEVKECLFMGLPGVAINGGNALAATIRGNEIITDTDNEGAAITLGINSTRCLVSYNKAAWGEETTIGALANPYVDNSGAANANAWVANFHCETITPPA